jgi:hypothetical protein
MLTGVHAGVGDDFLASVPPIFHRVPFPMVVCGQNINATRVDIC